MKENGSKTYWVLLYLMKAVNNYSEPISVSTFRWVCMNSLREKNISTSSTSLHNVLNRLHLNHYVRKIHNPNVKIHNPLHPIRFAPTKRGLEQLGFHGLIDEKEHDYFQSRLNWIFR